MECSLFEQINEVALTNGWMLKAIRGIESDIGGTQLPSQREANQTIYLRVRWAL
jgi:hypothetical protein